MKIKVNGKNEIIEENINLEQYLKNKNINKNSVVVMLNENIIKKYSFENTFIKENDSIEILRFVAGG